MMQLICIHVLWAGLNADKNWKGNNVIHVWKCKTNNQQTNKQNNVRLMNLLLPQTIKNKTACRGLGQRVGPSLNNKSCLQIIWNKRCKLANFLVDWSWDHLQLVVTMPIPLLISHFSTHCNFCFLSEKIKVKMKIPPNSTNWSVKAGYVKLCKGS